MASKKSQRKNTTKGKRKVQATPPRQQRAEASVQSNSPKSSTTSTQSSPIMPEKKEDLPFSRMNYILLLIGVLIIGFGFFLMSLDDFVDATEFSISLYIAPVVVVGGFLEVIYAIMYKPKQISTSDNSLSSS